ncbi:MAG TPA: RluA family pseudouridine synthase [Planctomycetaceae bacterium]|nr:RluA family pseudouridine synthase [Planctomycetaceae bacterium]
MSADKAKTFHVEPHEVQHTLVQNLRRWLPSESWSQVRKLLQGRQISVNGNLCLDEGRRLKPGDVVKVLAAAQTAPPREDDVRVRFIDSEIVIIEKPAGVTTMRHAEERSWPARRKQLQPTLDELLIRVVERQTGHRRKSKGKPHKPPRIRAVHRLDRETSGLMVFARTPVAEQKLIKQFSKHTIHRAYIAIVHGSVDAQTIESTLVRDRGDGRRGSSTAETPDDGQRAVTHVRPIEVLNGYTIVECRLETGRTHQIRIHLSEQGHMVCGERMYNKPLGGRVIVDESGAPRVALHAAELGFVHPTTGEDLMFKSPLPPDLQQLVKRLRQRRPES